MYLVIYGDENSLKYSFVILQILSNSIYLKNLKFPALVNYQTEKPAKRMRALFTE